MIFSAYLETEKGLLMDGIMSIANDKKIYEYSGLLELLSKESRDLSMTLFEDIRLLNNETYNSLARQRLTNIVLNQVYLSWALYQSAIEDYYLNMGVATTSEGIAEDITNKEGANKAISHLESARAIVDEANAFLSYIELQEAISRLYASIGMDVIDADVLYETPSAIAISIRKKLDEWNEGIFTASQSLNTPLSNKKPPLDISSRVLVPDTVVGAGSEISIRLPDEVFEQVNWNGEYKTVAGSLDDAGLPSWLTYSDETRTFTGTPSLDDVGSYRIKVYAIDKTGNSAVLSFTITVNNVYVHTMEYKGLNGYRRAKVYHKCQVGSPCASGDL